MYTPKIAIRADGNTHIGLGHIHRTLALAGYLKNYFSITFYLYQADELVTDIILKHGFQFITLADPDFNQPENFIRELQNNQIVVLDGYEFKTNYQMAIKTAGFKLVAIDDLNEWENVADVVINHAYSGSKSDYNISKSSQLLSGLEYAIIKQELFNNIRHIERKNNSNVLVCIGGTDPDNNSERIIKELLKSTNKSISLLTYPLNKKFNELKELAKQNSDRLHFYHSLNTNELVKLIRESDIAILQPSNIALEAATIGVYIGLVQTAENQKHIKKTLVDAACASVLDLDLLAENVNAVTVQKINEQISAQARLLDAKSSSRYINIFNQLVLAIRRVNASDVKLIYDWNNDPITRANSYNQNSIMFEDHEKWFLKKIVDADTVFFMLEYNNMPGGCVRIDNKSEENVIGITVAPEFRGKKLATPMLLTATSEYFKIFPSHTITAYIKKTNEASLKSFIGAGFKVQDEGNYFGEWSYKLNKRLNE